MNYENKKNELTIKLFYFKIIQKKNNDSKLRLKKKFTKNKKQKLVCGGRCGGGEGCGGRVDWNEGGCRWYHHH
jgi:hypothetical protein